MNRRGFITGLGASIVAAPAIVRAASLMQIRPTPTWVLRTSIPAPTWRIYGRSPAMDALPSLTELIDLNKATRHYMELLGYPTEGFFA